MKKQSLSKNFIYQFLYQGLILVIPLVLSPYLTRHLQESALGVYSYVNSIAYYFVIGAMLGISRHGQRIVSQRIGDHEALQRTFWSLFSVHAIVSAISLAAYFVFIVFFVKENTMIYVIEGFYVLSALFDITWFFYGLENFKSVVIKNAAVKLGECVLIFLFVKTPDDLWLYTVITAAGLFLGQAVMMPQAMRIVSPVKITKADMAEHIKPLLLFSISVIAVSLYTVFDKTLLGLMDSKESVAFYEYSNRIITIPKTVITVIGTVMFPRACKMAAQGDVAGQKKYIGYSLLMTSFIGMAAMFGIFAVADPFAVIYFGEPFAVCGSVMKALSPLILIIGLGDVIRTQYMIPNGLDKQFNFCFILNAILNIILSVALIPVIGIYGAVVGTVSAEICGIVYQMVICRKFIRFRELFLPLLPFCVCGATMFAAVSLIFAGWPVSIRTLLLQVLCGGAVYLVLSGIYIAIAKKEFLLIVKEKAGSVLQKFRNPSKKENS